MKYKDMDKEILIKILKRKDGMIKKLCLEKEKLNYYANIDAMTGALNRRSGLDLLSREINLSKINGNNIVVCFIDIDRLKIINDTFGHDEGDKVLTSTVKTIKGCIRKTDFVIRMGGDEFLIVFPETSIKEAKRIWCRVCRKIEATSRNSDKYNLTLSYGFYEYSNKVQKNISINNLIKKADQEMYKNKMKKRIMVKYV